MPVQQTEMIRIQTEHTQPCADPVIPDQHGPVRRSRSGKTKPSLSSVYKGPISAEANDHKGRSSSEGI